MRASWFPDAHKPVHPRAVVLLGAQRYEPTLGDAISDLEVAGKIATITAGWQERENDDDDLVEHLHGACVNLALHARAEDVFKTDGEFARAHRERQSVLRQRQDFYRIRLEHALDAAEMIRNRSAADEILEDEARTSIEEIQELDHKHLARCTRDQRSFEDALKPAERPAIAKHRKELADIVAECDAIAIAGGHVASLLNRLTLFGIADLVNDKVVFAWCAGAMAISERVVLFHDSPPQGPGAAEVLDTGLGLAKSVVVLPQSEFRLRMEDRERVSIMARRFAPALCLAMPARSRVTWIDGVPSMPNDVLELKENGQAGPVGVHSKSPASVSP